MDLVKLTPPTADLDVAVGTDWDFDIQWWQDDGTTAINIESFTGAILEDFTADAKTIMDFTLDANINNNVIMVRVPANETSLVAPGEYVWFITATSSTGETKGLVRGNAIVRAI